MCLTRACLRKMIILVLQHTKWTQKPFSCLRRADISDVRPTSESAASTRLSRLACNCFRPSSTQHGYADPQTPRCTATRCQSRCKRHGSCSRPVAHPHREALHSEDESRLRSCEVDMCCSTADRYPMYRGVHPLPAQRSTAIPRPPAIFCRSGHSMHAHRSD